MRTSNEDRADHAAPGEAAQRPSLRAEVFSEPKRGWQFSVVGNIGLLAEPLLGLISSRECPGHVLLETLERVPAWVAEGRVLVSRFHSPLEQQVLRSLLRREGRAVKVLARGMSFYRPSPDEYAALAVARLLVLIALAPAVQRSASLATTRSRAIAWLHGHKNGQNPFGYRPFRTSSDYLGLLDGARKGLEQTSASLANRRITLFAFSCYPESYPTSYDAAPEKS